MSSNDDILERYFGYLPSTPLAVVAAIAFFTASLPLFYQSYHYKNRLTYVLPFTGLAEFVGYVVRLYMIDHASLNVYIMMGMFIILPPNALAFANYKVLGKIIHAKAVHNRLPSVTQSSGRAYTSYSPIENDSTGLLTPKSRFYLPYLMNRHGEVHGNRLASFFFISDVVAIMLQGAGGGMQAGSNPDMGTNLLLIGLASQLFFFAVFTILAVYVFVSPMYQESIQENPALGDEKGFLSADEHTFAFYGLFWTIALLFVRNIYRVVEFATGYHGYLATTELLMYLFDTLFIFLSFVLYIYYNFAKFISKADAQIQREHAIINGFSGDSPAVPDKNAMHLDVHVVEAPFTRAR